MKLYLSLLIVAFVLILDLMAQGDKWYEIEVVGLPKSSRVPEIIECEPKHSDEDPYSYRFVCIMRRK